MNTFDLSKTTWLHGAFRLLGKFETFQAWGCSTAEWCLRATLKQVKEDGQGWRSWEGMTKARWHQWFQMRQGGVFFIMYFWNKRCQNTQVSICWAEALLPWSYDISCTEPVWGALLFCGCKFGDALTAPEPYRSVADWGWVQQRSGRFWSLVVGPVP